MASILIIDDDRMINDVLSKQIGRQGHYVRYITTLEKAYEVLIDEASDLVILDVRLPDGNGLQALPRLLDAPSRPEVIVFTAAGDAQTAETAIRGGAWDYLEKGDSLDALLLSVSCALQYRREQATQAVPSELRRNGIVGGSKPMEVCLDLLAQAAGSDANVLIVGETGTGKELFARAIHENSLRARGPYVVVDCAALPGELVESTLFGHEKGAFTGADEAREGLLKEADGGTLFLDEVGELPFSRQKAFLRILQERRFRPVGSSKEVTSDFRLVAATNRNLDQMVQDGQFRKDLLFRLRSFLVIAPPLRERPEDIPDISHHHAARFQRKTGAPAPKQFSPGFFEALSLLDWPGNVRELLQTLDRAFAASRDTPTLFPHHLPMELRVRIAQASVSGNGGKGEEGSVASGEALRSSSHFPQLKDFLEAHEREYLEALLDLTGGSATKAAEVSGLSRARLYVHLKDHGISPSRRRKQRGTQETPSREPETGLDFETSDGDQSSET